MQMKCLQIISHPVRRSSAWKNTLGHDTWKMLSFKIFWTPTSLSYSCHWIKHFILNGFTTTEVFIRVVPTVINPVAHLLRLQAYSIISASVRSCGWAKKCNWKKEKKQSISFGSTDLMKNHPCFSFRLFLVSFQIHNLAFLNTFCCGNGLHVDTREI